MIQSAIRCPRPVLVAASLLLALAPEAARGQEAPATDVASIAASLEREIERTLDETGAPSVSIALIRDGDVVWTFAEGYANVGARVPASVDTYYSTGSTFKFVTATAIMQLVESGALTLDTPVNGILGPELAIDGADDVTVRHLLSHHAGLDAFVFARRINREGPIASVPLWSRRPAITVEKLLSNTRRTGPPGTDFRYCNDCYGILGHIVERVSGQSFDAYVSEHVFRPLGVEVDRLSVPGPEVVEHMALPYELEGDVLKPVAQVRFDSFEAGDVYLKASDMARFLAAHLNDGEYRGQRLLSAASTAEMRRRQFDGRGYGLGVGVGSFAGHELIEHSGSIPGFMATFLAEPATGQGVYVMMNARGAGGERGAEAEAIVHLAQRAMQLMWGDDASASPAGRVEVAIRPETFDEYVGEYTVTPTKSFRFSREGERFFVDVTGQARQEVFPASETHFFLRTGSGSVTFGRDREDGPVTHLIVHKGSGDRRAERVP